MAPYYPVYLDVKDRLCVIIGGGPIGEGKIASLLECGADIRMICPDVTEDVQDMADTGVIHLERRVYEEGDLEGAFVVIAATDDNTVNRKIADEAERLGVQPCPRAEAAGDPGGQPRPGLCGYGVHARGGAHGAAEREGGRTPGPLADVPLPGPASAV